MEDDTYRFGEFSMSPMERRLFHNGKSVLLPPKAFDAMHLLVRSHGNLVSRAEVFSTLCIANDPQYAPAFAGIRDGPEFVEEVREAQRLERHACLVFQQTLGQAFVQRGTRSVFSFSSDEQEVVRPSPYLPLGGGFGRRHRCFSMATTNPRGIEDKTSAWRRDEVDAR